MTSVADNVATEFDWFAANGLNLSNVPNFVPDKSLNRLPHLEVFVDETGDRNFKPNRQSDWFAMAAVIVPHEHTDHVKAVVRVLRAYCSLPKDTTLHWVEHCRRKNELTRLVVRDILTEFQRVKVVHVRPRRLGSASVPCNGRSRTET